MEGQAREVRGEGKDGGGGEERDESPTTGMTKLSPLLRPPLNNDDNNKDDNKHNKDNVKKG
jgi:hypothetical protein